MRRRHPITGEPLLFAPGRALRPGAFHEHSSARCPFCPGHEDDTPPTIVQRGDPWHVRAFANKYPPADGAEVIVESRQHVTFDAVGHAREVVDVWIERYAAHHDSAFTALFRNEGVRAGASIAHVHSQLIPLPFVPPRVRNEARAFGEASLCPLCPLDAHLIRETPTMRWLCPEGSSFAWQQWIVPRRHVAEISELGDAERDDLAALLREASAAMLRLGDAYNWYFMNFRGQEKAHWYVELVPRLTSIAGFELATGTFVEIIDPAAAAQRLRG